MRMIEANGVLHHVREDGDTSRRTVIFSNSLGTDLRLWDLILPHLPANLRYVRYDKRGHGLSDCPDGPFTMDQLVADAIALMERLELRDCVFVGLSIGGMIAQGLAATRPDLTRALVLSNTAARMGDAAMWQARIDAIRHGGLGSISDAVMERWFSPSFRAGSELPGWRNMFQRTPAEGYLGCCSAIAAADLSADTSKLALPVLGIAGEFDGASAPDLVAATVNTIDGSRMETLPSVGHLPCVEAPEAYAALLTEFFEEIGHV